MLRLVKGASVVGFARSQFQANGQTVYGYSVCFTYPFVSQGAEGSGVGSFWMSKKAFEDYGLDVGSSIDVARVRVGDRSKYELVT